MRNYEVKQISGSEQYGIFVEGRLLARIERGMERESLWMTEMLTHLWKAEQAQVQQGPLRMEFDSVELALKTSRSDDA